MVKCAKKCYEEYPTIVNALKESGITYKNTKLAYSQMDNKFAKSRIGIGWSSNLAQLAMTYYWTEPNKELYDNFIILSVLAQVIIDGCKREYEVDGMEEIERIQKMSCMNLTRLIYKNGKEKEIKCDLPKFMKYTKEVPYTKNGVELPYDIVKSNKNKITSRINYDLVCPMNWLQEILDEIQPISSTNTIPTENFFVKMEGKPNHRQISKMTKLVNEYDDYIKNNRSELEYDDISNKFQELLDSVAKMKVGNIITINRLIQNALGLEYTMGRPNDKSLTKYTRKMLNVLYKMNREKFLSNFAENV